MKHITKLIVLAIPFTIASCEDFVAIDPPHTQISRTSVFESEATANAAMSAIYYQMISESFSSGGISSITFITALSSDELINYNAGGGNQEYQQINDNEILPTNKRVERLWNEGYEYIYQANAIIEGLQHAHNLNKAIRDQLTGEAKFIRAFAHFYLTNLFGDIPLVTSTDYRINSKIERTPQNHVYEQLIRDLIEAKELMSTNFLHSGNERTRPNSWSASALLSRTYLYANQWENAEQEVTHILSSPLFSMEADLNDVFLKNSQEAIWQLAPRPGSNTMEASTFVITGYPRQAAFSLSFLDGFETNDKRVDYWIGTAHDNGTTYHYPYKYKAEGPTDPTQEYSMVLRLAEQYLIRAEARANLNKTEAALEDLNTVRNRAGLEDLELNDTSILLEAIEKERRSEFFVEWGHRWCDLKRLQRADAVLSGLKPTWNATDLLYPIPQSQILGDPNMTTAQNPGY